MSPISLSLTPELLRALKERTSATLSTIVKTNSATTYFQEAPLLLSLRKEIDSLHAETYTHVRDVHDLDSAAVIRAFEHTVPLSSYDDYLPFISRLRETPCLASRVTDLLSPGLPDVIVHSSGTSGGAAKLFPKSCLVKQPLLPLRPGTKMCTIYNLASTEVLNIVSESKEQTTPVKRVPLSLMSTGAVRLYYGITLENEESLMAQNVPSTNVFPLAVSFIKRYRTSLFMHGLFAVRDPSLSLLRAVFGSTIYDFMRLVEEQWDSLVQVIESGTLPDIEGLEDVATHLQAQLQPDATRAAELRAIDVGSEGWLKEVWPSLNVVKGTWSGQYANFLPKVRHCIGPSVTIAPGGMVMSECIVCYSGTDLEDFNIFKIDSGECFEYLDVEMEISAKSVCHAWEVVPGRKYELIATTRDGLWRYRLGDIMEIAGFDPVDGQPLIRYIERRDGALRVANEYSTHGELQCAIRSLMEYLGRVVEFTAFVDDRQFTRAYGFAVELEGELGTKANEAVSHLHTWLCTTNELYARYVKSGTIGTPTIRIVAPGTFQMYREWKVQVSGSGSGQVKVPIVMHDAKSRDWLLRWIVKEV